MKEKLKELFETVDPTLLTEEFNTKIEVLFEAAVSEKVSSMKEEIREAAEKEILNEVDEFKTGLISKVDSFLTEALDEYFKENKTTIEESLQLRLKSQIADAVIGVIKENSLTIPEDQKGIFDSLNEENVNLKEELGNKNEENLHLKEENLRLQCSRIFDERTKTLTDVKRDKLKNLISEMDFSDTKVFSGKLDFLIESLVEDSKKKEEIVVSESAKYASLL